MGFLKRATQIFLILILLASTWLYPNQAQAGCADATKTAVGVVIAVGITSAIGTAVLGPVGIIAGLYGASYALTYNNMCIEYPAGYRDCLDQSEENLWTRSEYEKCIAAKEPLIGKHLTVDHTPMFYGKDYMPERYGKMYISYGYSGAEKVTEIDIDSCKWVTPGYSLSVGGIAAALTLLPAQVCVEKKADLACATITSFFPNAELGCHYTEPSSTMRSMCLDPSNGHRVYGYQNVTDTNGNKTQRVIKDPSQQHLSDPPGCPKEYPTSCFTYWRWDQLLPRNNDIKNMNGHPFKSCVSNQPNKGVCSTVSFNTATPTQNIDQEYCDKKKQDFNDPHVSNQDCVDLEFLSPNGIYYLGESRMTGNFIMSDYHFVAPLVQCVTETVSNTIKSTDIFSSNKDFPAGMTKFQIVQQSLKKAVSAALVLFVVLFSLKTTLSHDIPKKGDLFIAMMKIVLVLYFAAGPGIQEYYELLMQFSAWLGGVILEGARTDSLGGLCNQLDMIKSGRLIDENSIGFWDTLDCRFVSYLGYGSSPDRGTMEIGQIFLASLFGLPPFVGWLIFLLLLIVLLLLFSFIVQFMMVYIVATMAIVLALFIAPLIVPMMLFSATGSIFKSYIKELISYSTYPIVMFAFLSLYIATLDTAFYGDTIFSKEGYMEFDKSYKVKDPDCVSQAAQLSTESEKKEYIENCPAMDPQPKRGDLDVNGNLYVLPCDHDGVACTMGRLIRHNLLEIPTFIGPNIPMIWFGWSDYWTVLIPLVKLMLMLYIFYSINKSLPELVSEFTGNFQTNLGNMAPNIFNKVRDLAVRAVKAKVSGGASEAGGK